MLTCFSFPTAIFTHALTLLFLSPCQLVIILLLQPDGQQQRDQQDRPPLPQLPRLHRQPQHPAGHQGRCGGDLLQVRQDLRLLRPQGLRLRPVLQREERQGRRGRGGRPHDRWTGAR